VPGYEILQEIGRGGMGVVYKARQSRLNRVVALKMILAGEYAAKEAIERFMAEAEIVARLQHPNIVRIHALGDFEGRPFVELEYVEGGSLEARLVGRPWPPRAAAELVASLASALSEAHRMGIVHRDLKPANILMTEDGAPKLTDFGLAKSVEKNSGWTRTESILGSPSYMAPEQAEGRARDVGPLADVYALGANLYELLTGRPPFVGPSILATLDLVKNAEPVAPRQLQPGVASDLETICLKCLKKEPGERYESAEALAEDLNRYLKGEPVRARPTPRWERAWKWMRRRPTMAALVVVSAASLFTAVAGGLWYQADQARQQAAVSRHVEGVWAQVKRFLSLGQEALRRGDWEGAKAHASSALALIRTEPRLAGLDEAASSMLALCDLRIAGRKAREAARARLATFQRSYDAAVFYQSQYTGLAPEANLRASRAAARRALEQFEPSGDKAAGLALDPGVFDAAQVDDMTERYYELALILAEATAQPMASEDPAQQAREALRILDRIERVRPPTKAFFLCRAACLKQLGVWDGAEDQRNRADPAGISSVDDFLEGEAAYRQRDYARAIPAFQRILARQPDHFWSQYLLAICLLKEHRADAAQAALTTCQAVRPGFVWTYLLKGFAEGETGDFDLAEADFAHANELGLSEAERYVMLVNRGVIRFRQGRIEAASEDLQKAIASKPDQFQAYINLSQVFQKRQRFDQALLALDQAIARAPGQAVLHRARAQVHRLRSDESKALADLDRAIALSPQDDPSLAGDHLERALIFQKAGRDTEALTACDRALVVQPGQVDVHRLRGAVLVRSKRFDEAIRSFDVCLARGAPSAALYEARGLALANCGLYERAIDDYTLALRTGRATASLYTHRGWAYLFSGAPAPAAHDFDAAMRLDPSDGRALSGRALANVQQRKVAEAIADAQASAATHAQDPRSLYSAARVYCQAAACLEADPARSPGSWKAAGRYRADALALITRSLSLMPAAERRSFWSQVIRPDTTLEPIRRSSTFQKLEAQYPRTIGLSPPDGASPR
jgi:tetratricopeptide (TPR) repeat protein/tRNA A-37 threonylcarbamoyl transferase component Bud32